MNELPPWAVMLAIVGVLNLIVLACAWLIDALDEWRDERKKGPRNE